MGIAVGLAGSATLLVRSASRTLSVASLAERQASLLMYAPLSNRLQLVEWGAVRTLDTNSTGHRLNHHAYPALSPSGHSLAYVRPSSTSGGEDIVLYRCTERQERVLLTWPGEVWSLAWGPKGSILAFTADRGDSSRRNTSLYLTHLDGARPENLTPGIEWVSTYSQPAWSPSEDRIAFEKYSRTPEGDVHRVMIVDVASKSTATVADGWFPSWSPDGAKIAYVTVNGSRCYEVDLRTNRCRLLWWSTRTLLFDDIIGPPVWSPSGQGAMFNVTSGMKGDSRSVYYVDFKSGDTRRVVYDPDFAVVGWLRSEPRGLTDFGNTR